MSLRITLITLLFLLFVNASTAQDSLTINYDSLFAKVYSNQIEYKTLSERARLIWNDGSSEQELFATIRTKRDSVVWLSIGMFGIEGVRALLTTDSFSYISKLTNEYTSNNFSLLQQWILFPVNFNMLQHIISGSKFEINALATFVAKEDSIYALYEETNKLKQTIWVDTGNYTIRKILLKDQLLNQDMEITFGAYNTYEGKPFPYTRSIVIHRNEQTVKLSMEILKLSTNTELAFPFEVTKKYKE